MLILDGGVRSGEDICKALALGADFVLMGRPFVYAVAALGLDGPSHLLKIVHDELSRARAQLRACSIPELANVKIIDTALAGASEKALSEAASPGRFSDSPSRNCAGMSGTELAELVRQRRPDVKLVLTSGYIREEGAPSEFEFVPKPWRIDQVAKVVGGRPA